MVSKQDGHGNTGGSGTGNTGDEIQRWTALRKAAVVIDIMKGKATATDIARQHDLTVGEVEAWIEKFLDGGREGLRAVPRELEAKFDAERKDLLAKVGELTLQVDALKKKSSSASTLISMSGQAANL